MCGGGPAGCMIGCGICRGGAAMGGTIGPWGGPETGGPGRSIVGCRAGGPVRSMDHGRCAIFLKSADASGLAKGSMP